MRIILLTSVVWVSYGLFAQSFDRNVFATAGRDASNGLTGISRRLMTYTIGEPIIYRGSNTLYSLNNGFIQPIGISPVAPPSPSGMILAPGDIEIYPNPFGTYIMLNGQEESQDEVSLQLIDMQGKLILQQAIVPHNYKLEIPQNCAPGTYLLNIYTPSGQFIQQNRLIKMNVESDN